MTWDEFFSKWASADGSERANGQPYFIDLCHLVNAPTPGPDNADSPYAFEYPVVYEDDGFNRRRGVIDCYKAGCLVAEFKQSNKRTLDGDLYSDRLLTGRRSRFKPRPGDAALMLKARAQAERNAKNLPEWPPFILLIDVAGYIEVFADFARQGKGYAPYPDRNSYRISIRDLRDPVICERLRQIICDPMSLDPLRGATTATLDVIKTLEDLTRSIATSIARRSDNVIDINASRKKAAQFVMQCLVGMFADAVTDEGKPFLQMLKQLRTRQERVATDLTTAFQHWSLFRDADFREALCAITHQTMAARHGVALTPDQLEKLIACADRNWCDVEPAVFGSLIMLALDSEDQRRRGAHFTPRAFVEQLVRPTIIDPLQEEWRAVQRETQAASTDVAEARLTAFLRKISKISVLDPACGTGNFLYVAMLALKDLEQEVHEFSARLFGTRALERRRSRTMAIRLDHFHGRDIDAQAVQVARLTLWIGVVQWNYRHGVQPLVPAPPRRQTIIQQDALLSDVRQHGRATRAPTSWPSVDFIIGNPPFMGAKDMRRRLTSDYVQDLRDSCHGRDASRDLSMYYWDRAAQALKAPGSRLQRFGLITSNTIVQAASRQVVARHLVDQKMHLVHAIADHPWNIAIGGAGCHAAVRIAMTTAQKGPPTGTAELLNVNSDGVAEGRLNYAPRTGVILPDLTIGPDLRRARKLAENKGKASRGVQRYGAGLIVKADEGQRLIALSAPDVLSPLRCYVGSPDIISAPRDLRIIDVADLSEDQVRRLHPGVYDHLLRTIPEHRRLARPDRWWRFDENRPGLRRALKGLDRFIVTVETAKRRWFTFAPGDGLPDNKLIAIASEDAAILAVLSSRIHRIWYDAHAGRFGDQAARVVYAKGDCFDKFPFPRLPLDLRQSLAREGERLDQLRTAIIAQNPHLTVTQIYDALLAPEKAVVRPIGLSGIADCHNRIDHLTFAAYGWPMESTDDEILLRLVDLNVQRCEQETAPCSKDGSNVLDFQRPLQGVKDNSLGERLLNRDAATPFRGQPSFAIPG